MPRHRHGSRQPRVCGGNKFDNPHILFYLRIVLTVKTEKMKKSRMIYAACLLALLAGTSCKTAQKSQQSETTTQNAHKQSTQSNMQTLSAKLLNGEWLFTSACGKAVTGDSPVRIIFDTATHRVYGNNGCNVFNGSLEMGEGTSMAFPNCVTTLMACRPEVTDGNVMQAIGATTHYSISKQTKDELTINLLDKEGNVTATLSRQLRELLNGRWTITEVNGRAVSLEEMPTAVLDITDKKITGSAGCNLMNGGIVYDAGTVNNGIRFSHIATTRKMCAPEAMRVESEILNALQEVDAFRFIDENHVGLYAIPSATNSVVLERK